MEAGGSFGIEGARSAVPPAPYFKLKVGLAAVSIFVIGSVLGFLLRHSFGGGNTSYPPKYGKVPEKTLWFFYDKGFRPVPNVLMGLCVATWKLNHPDWNFEFISDSNLFEYVHPRWLPDKYFTQEHPANKKDVVMGALLAAYGGVAADGTIINFKSITPWWDELVVGNQTFRGWRYSWGETVGWFWMARRDSGVLRRYVSDVTLRMGQNVKGSAIPGKTYLALAAGSMDPILEEIDSSLTVCREVMPEGRQEECSQGKLYHHNDNKDLKNQKLAILDPRHRDYGPELTGMAELIEPTDEPLWSAASGQQIWKDYESKKNNDNFMIAKFFNAGGKWAKAAKKIEDFIKPDGTPDAEVNIFGALFKAAGLSPQRAAEIEGEMFS